MMNYNRNKGFTLVELMVAMVVGLIVVSGAFSLHIATRKTQQVSEGQMNMVADSRFAVETIAYDLRHAGMWGATNLDGLIDCKSSDAACVKTANNDTPPTTATNDCYAGWFTDLQQSVFATDDTAGNPYLSTCIPSTEGYLAGTDILEVRYADSNAPITPLASDLTFVRSNFSRGRIFVGAQAPLLDAYDDHPSTANHTLHAFAYYISDHTDAAGDKIPSLRRATLSNGPEIKNQTLLSGVVDLQVQFGLDLIGDDEVVDSYVDASTVTATTDGWLNVYSAKIWLVMRSEKEDAELSTDYTFDMAGQSVDYGGSDDYRYFMVSSVVNFRNIKKIF